MARPEIGSRRFPASGRPPWRERSTARRLPSRRRSTAPASDLGGTLPDLEKTISEEAKTLSEIDKTIPDFEKEYDTDVLEMGFGGVLSGK